MTPEQIAAAIAAIEADQAARPKPQISIYDAASVVFKVNGVVMHGA